jgi:hypothetical protein
MSLPEASLLGLGTPISDDPARLGLFFLAGDNAIRIRTHSSLICEFTSRPRFTASRNWAPRSPHVREVDAPSANKPAVADYIPPRSFHPRCGESGAAGSQIS